MSFSVFPRFFLPQAVTVAVIVLQQRILGDTLQTVGAHEVVDNIKVATLLAKLLVFEQGAVKLEVEHPADATLNLS